MQYANVGKPRARTQFLDLVPKIHAGIEDILMMDTVVERTTATSIEESWELAREEGLAAMGGRRSEASPRGQARGRGPVIYGLDLAR